MGHFLKINGVMSIELKCEECFQNATYRETKHVIDKEWNMNKITLKPQDPF